MAFEKIFDMHKTWPSKHLTECRKSTHTQAIFGIKQLLDLHKSRHSSTSEYVQDSCFEFVELIFHSWNLVAMIVRMAKHFWPSRTHLMLKIKFARKTLCFNCSVVRFTQQAWR